MKRAIILFVPLIALALCIQANAQGYYEFLGAPRAVPDQVTQKYSIRHNTQGFDNPIDHNIKKMEKKGASTFAIQEVLVFPGTPDAFSTWIDDAFDQTMAEFTACGGDLAQKASRVSPQNVYVVIEPSAFFVPEAGYACAGVYYPDRHEIHVLNIYYTWGGQYNGWLRNAKDLLKWEMENYFAMEVGIQPEPRTPHWPADAPAK